MCKDIFNHPRPYNLDESVKIGRTGGPGLPSGHAQQSLTVWGYLSLWMKQASFTYISIIVILLIAFSRIYLGVHFPTDIAGGWIIALVVLFAGFYSADRIEQFVNRIDRRIAVVFLILLPVMLSLFYPSSSSLMSMGTFSGAAIGIVIETGAINFQPVKSLKQGLIRYCSGIIVLGIIYYTGRLLPAKNTHAGMFAVYIHSWIMGIVVSAGMPLIYKRAGV